MSVDTVKAGESLERLDSFATSTQGSGGGASFGIDSILSGGILPALASASSSSPATSSADNTVSGGNQQVTLDSEFIVGDGKTEKVQLVQTLVVGGLAFLALLVVFKVKRRQ